MLKKLFYFVVALFLAIQFNIPVSAQEYLVVKSSINEFPIKIKIWRPTTQDTKGIVLFIPGSDGKDGSEQKTFGTEQDWSSSHPNGGLSNYIQFKNFLNDNGYVFISFNKAGRYDVSDCLKSKEERSIEDYWEHCYDNQIMQIATHRKNEEDITRIFNAVKSQDSLANLKIVLFAFSKGGDYVHRLVGTGRLNPDGIVNLGVSTESVYEDWMARATDQIAFRKVFSYMKKNNKNFISVNEITDKVLKGPDPIELKTNYLRFQEFRDLNIDAMLPITSLKDLHKQHVDRAKQYILDVKNANGQLGLGTYFDDHFISGDKRYSHNNETMERESIFDNFSVLDHMKNYRGARVYLHGEYDHITISKKNQACTKNAKCRVQEIKGLGHSMYYSSKFNHSVRKTLLQSIQFVMSK